MVFRLAGSSCEDECKSIPVFSSRNPWGIPRCKRWGNDYEACHLSIVLKVSEFLENRRELYILSNVWVRFMIIQGFQKAWSLTQPWFHTTLQKVLITTGVIVMTSEGHHCWEHKLWLYHNFWFPKGKETYLLMKIGRGIIVLTLNSALEDFTSLLAKGAKGQIKDQGPWRVAAVE